MGNENYNDLETVLAYIAKHEDVDMSKYSSFSEIELKPMLKKLRDEKLIKSVMFGWDSKADYIVTELGQNVVNQGGYKAYKLKLEQREQKILEKERLEFELLKQSVRINKWQFWIMIIGGIGGILSFIFLVYQFLFGTNGLLNDLFNY